MPDDSWEDYETGPFCRHYHDPGDCDKPCERCGHSCSAHGAGVEDDDPCSRDGCACYGWVDDRA